MKSKKRTIKGSRGIRQKAIELLNDGKFLFRACEKIGELGVVGEKRNRLVLFLAGIARTLPEPPSVMIKGPSSSGKSTIVKAAVQLFPPQCVVERAGLSGKALAHRKQSLAQKILFIHEYRCGKDAQQLLRLLQSEGRIEHEFTKIGPRGSGTKTVKQVGKPVVLTTTTASTVYTDDETRFVSCPISTSQAQTHAIYQAIAKGSAIKDSEDLPLWRAATSRLRYKEGDFEHPPTWLRYVATKLPRDDVRGRRDWPRFLAFTSAIALCRSHRDGHRVDITFADYCVAYRIFEPVFAFTRRALPHEQLTLAKTVAKLIRRFGRSVTVREIANELNWKERVVYKRAKAAKESGLIEYEKRTRERNVKRIRARDEFRERFLPNPIDVLHHNPQIGRKLKYIDPFTGERKVVRR